MTLYDRLNTDMENVDKDYYCAAPFVNISYTPAGNIQPCCEWHENSNEVDDIDLLARIRSNFLNNKPEQGCKVCHKAEAANVPSTRLSFNNQYGRPTTPVLRQLDMSLGNLCNFKCRICSSLHSAKWASDELAMGKKPHKLYRHTWDELKTIDISNVDTVKFKGGEPFLEQPAIINTLRTILTQKGSLADLDIVINTNASVSIDPELIDLLSMCKHVILAVSIDGYDKVNDYQRTGSEWEIVQQNMTEYQKSLPANVELIMWTVWTILNVNNAITLLDWATHHLPRYNIHGAALHFPYELAIRNIPHSMKQQLRHDLENWVQLDHCAHIINHKMQLYSELSMDNEIDIQTVRNHIKTLDIIRRENFFDIDPAMYNAIFT